MLCKSYIRPPQVEVPVLPISPGLRNIPGSYISMSIGRLEIRVGRLASALII
jgi:hypothetical protein